MGERETRRLFFALWPGGRERKKILDYSPLLQGCGGRKVPPQNLHITLAFVGSVTSDLRDCLIDAADAISLPPFTVQLERLGFWRRSRAVWLGSDEAEPELSALVEALKTAMQSCGLEPEEHPFRTHVTLMRKAHRGPRKQAVPVLEWPVQRFVLAASETRPEGASYQILKSWDLTTD